MTVMEEINKIIEEKRHLFIEASDKIWEFAETRFEEFKSSELLCSILKDEGFTIKKDLAGMKTAFVASYGQGKPEIAILGEYDALYSLSQEAGAPYKKQLTAGGNGHGCGHHALGAGALAAAISVKEYIKEHNISGTIHYFGCPGEEGGSGKVYMVRDKLFKDIDTALTWHPGNSNTVLGCSFLANIQVYFKFYGKSSHAAAAPHMGRSALDALELMNIGANFLREHIVQEARIHYAITNSGGFSPNVVQSEASVLYLIRAPKIEQVMSIYERVVNIAKGATLMTDTRVEIVFDRASSNLVTNDTLNKVLYENFLEASPMDITENDVSFAKEIINTLSDNERKEAVQTLKTSLHKKDKILVTDYDDIKICNFISPYKLMDIAVAASTDVGDVSWVVPTAQISSTCFALGTTFHSWQLVSQGKSELCHKGLLQAGKVIGTAAIELMQNPEIVEKAKLELAERLEGQNYVCPIPDDVKPSPMR